MAAEGLQADDLARLRAIAEEGRQRPLLGGHSLLVWGGAITLAAAMSWSVMARLITLPYWSISAIWFGLMTGAALLSRSFERRSSGSGAALSVGNRVSRSVWQMAGAFLATLAIGLTLHAAFAARASDGGATWAMLSVMAPVTFGVFGIALAATAVSGNAPWLQRFAWLSFAFTIVTAALLGQLIQQLVMALGAICVGVIPGLQMIKAARDG